MEETAKLITAFGVLLGAVAWPVCILTITLIFRTEIRGGFQRLPGLLDRMRKMKVAGIEAELDEVANASANVSSGEVTPLQIEAAARITVKADSHTDVLSEQLDRLCLEYDAIRRSMPAGSNRTEAMTRVLVKMRALAPTLVGRIQIYKGSGSSGSRLAAIAMMQMNPAVADVEWLAKRFEHEQPFLFYHAALALENIASNELSDVERIRLLGVAQQGLQKVKSFSGTPDKQTVNVLQNLISSISQ
ncbi:hypothetical protein HRV97_12370 [Sphingomonas sp. HHU CXW]|uniref:Uncharacterized protein n=1 Tax=Sphingomonas hominis TaxID=2741495 RepID=A0ABX2JQ43_9SPHN|nr:hypothetical protein [Sphingomonas hominis]NTS65953.1 hypothetical protein [Sphingomonas hominis]